MLSDLQQLLSCRRERENRAADALCQTRLRLDQAKAGADAARQTLEDHHRERRERQDKLYRRSLRARLTKQDIDDLNIELDLMAETTDALQARVQEADKLVAEATKEVEAAALHHRQLRQAGDRFGHLVDDVTASERRRLEQAEEFMIEDDLGDRRAATRGDL
ncbi:MAG: YscO family type III secretion system apparatus protein [Pseudomonadota bacterium]